MTKLDKFEIINYIVLQLVTIATAIVVFHNWMNP